MATATTKPTATLVNVTPKIAGDWIAKNDHNRNVRNQVVSAYARDMAAGAWQITGEAIKFNCDGTLLDGQHRLLAVIRSGATVPMLIVKGLPKTAQDVMDTGTKRSAGDMLFLNGHKNGNLLAATARLLMVLESSADDTRNTSRNFTNTEIAAKVSGTRNIESAVAAASHYRAAIDVNPSVLAVAWMWLHRANPAAAEEFFESIAENQTNGAGDPRNTLIKRLATARRNGERLNQTVVLSFIVRSWNAWRAGERLAVLRDRASDHKGGTVQVGIPKVSA